MVSSLIKKIEGVGYETLLDIREGNDVPVLQWSKSADCKSDCLERGRGFESHLEFKIERIINRDETVRIPEDEKRFCSYKCSNVRIFTEEQNKSKGRKRELSKLWKGGYKFKLWNCESCGKKNK